MNNKYEAIPCKRRQQAVNKEMLRKLPRVGFNIQIFVVLSSQVSAIKVQQNFNLLTKSCEKRCTCKHTKEVNIRHMQIYIQSRNKSSCINCKQTHMQILLYERQTVIVILEFSIYFYKKSLLDETHWVKSYDFSVKLL